jgi:NADPH-dependent 2,4-dienoyl-CoA reductase/sulfur reductase-like enzyme/rhodanese-related sulfurtransferase
MSKRFVIVGGVAAGASAAAKARRTSEAIEIALFEAGPYISFANCGLPYYVGGEIAERGKLFVVSERLFAARFGVDVRPNTTVTAIDRGRKIVAYTGADGPAEEMTYDGLLLATGTVAIRPPIAGLGRKDIFTVRTVPDVDAIVDALSAAGGGAAAGTPGRAVIIGGGYIGLETAEQLLRRGLEVTVVEMADQLMLTLDAEIARCLQDALEVAGGHVILGDAVREVADRDGRGVVITNAGRELPFDIGILAAGVRPNVALAEAAGLELGATGAVQVDRFQRTSDPAIYAAGDNSEVHHLVLGRPVNVPLAGPSNKTGRVAGANAALDLQGASDDDPRRLHLRGVLGTGIVRVCGQTAAMTGLTEAAARREGLDAAVMYLPGFSHAGYYPDAQRILTKLLYDPATGKLLGAQAAGGEGVDKRTDVFATAIAAGMTVEDLEHLDLCYAPPFGSAKDIEILGGFAASNARRGVMPSMTPAELLAELAGDDPPVVIDVRSPGEYAAGHLDQAINIPLDELRGRLDDVPAAGKVAVHCGVGYRSYLAQQILMNHGRTNVRNILGGYLTIQQVRKARAAQAI